MMLRALVSVLLLGALTAPAMAQTAFDDPLTSSAGSGGALVAVEPSVAIGAIALGSTAQAIVRFRNDAGQPISFSEINIYPSSNVSASIALNQCAAAPLPFGGECAIVLAVKALKAGEFQSQLLIQHSGRAKLITATVTGTVAAGDKEDGDQDANEIQATPASLDFGSIETSRPVLKTIQLRNTTSEALTINSVSFDSPQKSGFEVRSACKELAAGQSCLVSVVWSPLVPGPTSGFLVIDHTGTSKLTNLAVEGQYRPSEIDDVSKYPSPVPGKGLLVASKDQVAFGDAVDTESAITVTLENGGDSNLTLKNMSMSVTTPGLSLDPSGCKIGTVLAPSEACPLTIRWAPQKISALRTDLRIAHDGARGVFVLPVNGKATAVVNSSSGFSSGVASISVSDATDGISTDLPGSAGLSLSDIDELNSALTGDIADVINRSTGKKTISEKREEAQTSSSASSLSSYIITTHSINRAVIVGPQGSKVISHNKAVVIDGVSWTPKITPEGVDMEAGKKTVSLVFDESLSANQGMLTDNSKPAEEGSAVDGLTDDAAGTPAAQITETPIAAATPETPAEPEGSGGLNNRNDDQEQPDGLN